MTERLRPVFHPTWGSVNPMRETEQATHVWQQLYNPVERWDGLVGTDIQALRSAAEERGSPPQPLKPPPGQERPRLPWVPMPCYMLLKEQHDAYYGPAYLRELEPSRTEWERQERDPAHLLMCCTPRGVLVAVGLGRPTVVLTAFCPDLPFEDGSDVDDDTFHQVAQERWERLTMREDSTWKRGVLRELEQASHQHPQRTVDAWRLARAIGHARALVAKEPDIATRLRTAEALLARHRQDVSRLLEGKLRAEALLGGLQSALAAEEPHEAQDRLLAISDLLVVSEVLGHSSELKRIHDRVRQLTASWPPGLTGFERLAHARLGTSGPAVRPLWEAVLAARPSAWSPLAAAQAWLDAARTRIAERLSGGGGRGDRPPGGPHRESRIACFRCAEQRGDSRVRRRGGGHLSPRLAAPRVRRRCGASLGRAPGGGK
ncbi:hypothetical protein [Cystobacter ferrugineus]|uniref:Uncharacterized protein n=1 Tax=Cystobacter ferrugineus TaxID=83449 RepID=A0A1L9ATT1_9BACT|nr:hypothetical protein [Cystobacter ferrugineus]OJH33411.1 hypothetical protein BON30_48860 [Cystobacter ferrugineus]